MSNYTQFKFPQLGQRAIVKINGVLALADTWYPQGAVITAERAINSHVGEPYDEIPYQVQNGGLLSNEAPIILNFPPNKNLQPVSNDVAQNIINNTIYGLESYIPYNTAVDRLRIVSYDDTGILQFNGSNVFPNLEIMQYDFSKLKFTSTTGQGYPYFRLRYQVGNINGYNPAIYTISLTLNGLASLLNWIEAIYEEIRFGGVETYSIQQNTIRIVNGIYNKIAHVRVTVNLSSSAWPVDNQNFLTINMVNQSIDVTANGIYLLEGLLPVTSELNLIAILSVNTLNLPVTGTILYELIDIDGNTDKIGPSNTVNLNINL